MKGLKPACILRTYSKFRLLNSLPLHPKTRIVNPFPLEMFPLKQTRLKVDWSGNAIVASECLKSSFHQ